MKEYIKLKPILIFIYIRSLYQIKTFLVHCYDNAFFRYAAVPTLIMLTTVFVHLLELDSI